MLGDVSSLEMYQKVSFTECNVDYVLLNYSFLGGGGVSSVYLFTS